jgi:hypothetical protein
MCRLCGQFLKAESLLDLITLVLFGAVLALVLYPWQMVVREDGSRVLVERHLTFYQELASSWHVFKNNLWILFFW